MGKRHENRQKCHLALSQTNITLRNIEILPKQAPAGCDFLIYE